MSEAEKQKRRDGALHHKVPGERNLSREPVPDFLVLVDKDAIQTIKGCLGEIQDDLFELDIQNHDRRHFGILKNTILIWRAVKYAEKHSTHNS